MNPNHSRILFSVGFFFFRRKRFKSCKTNLSLMFSVDFRKVHTSKIVINVERIAPELFLVSYRSMLLNFEKKCEKGKAEAESRSCHSSEACRSCPLLKFQCYFGASIFSLRMNYSGICAMLRTSEILIVSVARCIDYEALKISNCFLPQ